MTFSGNPSVTSITAGIELLNELVKTKIMYPKWSALITCWKLNSHPSACANNMCLQKARMFTGVFDGLLVAAGLLASLVTNAQGNIHIQCASAIEKAPGSSGKRGHHLALAVCGCDWSEMSSSLIGWLSLSFSFSDSPLAFSGSASFWAFFFSRSNCLQFSSCERVNNFTKLWSVVTTAKHGDFGRIC